MTGIARTAHGGVGQHVLCGSKGEQIAILSNVLRGGGLNDEVIFKLRAEGGKAASHTGTWGRTF